MKLLQKFRTFVVLAFVLSILTAASLGSCESKSNDDDKESTEHPAADTTKKDDHPKAAEPEHPKKDTTKVEN